MSLHWRLDPVLFRGHAAGQQAAVGFLQRNRHYGCTGVPAFCPLDIGQHRDIRSDYIFGLATLIGDMNNAAIRCLRYRAYSGVRHHTFGSYVPGTLTFADPPHRFWKHAQLNRVNFTVGAAHAPEATKSPGLMSLRRRFSTP